MRLIVGGMLRFQKPGKKKSGPVISGCKAQYDSGGDRKENL